MSSIVSVSPVQFASWLNLTHPPTHFDDMSTHSIYPYDKILLSIERVSPKSLQQKVSRSQNAYVCFFIFRIELQARPVGQYRDKRALWKRWHTGVLHKALVNTLLHLT